MKSTFLPKNFGQNNLGKTQYGVIIKMMKKNNVFEKYAEEYDEWFDVHPWVYRSEVEAVKMALYMS